MLDPSAPLKDITMHPKIAKPIYSTSALGRLDQIQSQLSLVEMRFQRNFLSALKVYGENKKRSQTETGDAFHQNWSETQYNNDAHCPDMTLHNCTKIAKPKDKDKDKDKARCPDVTSHFAALAVNPYWCIFAKPKDKDICKDKETHISYGCIV